MTLRSSLLAAAAFTLAAPAFASQVVPANPTAFQDVNLRLTVDSCTFVPGSVHVSQVANTLRVTQQLNNCLLPGTPRAVDVRLGTLPVGQYRVEVHGTVTASGAPLETLAFEVTSRPVILIFPPPPRPLANYTGMWWNPQEGGWGLSLYQSPFDEVLGTLFVYDNAGNPQWFSIQPGSWSGYAKWSGLLYRTSGPYFAGPGYDPRLVLVLPAGTATLDFEAAPGNGGRVTFTYTVNGVTTTKTITRMAL